MFRYFRHSQLALTLAKRCLGTLDIKTLTDIGLIRRIILNTDFTRGAWKEFENALMTHLMAHDMILKGRAERYILNLGQDPKKEKKKNWFVALFESIKSKLNHNPIVDFFRRIF